MKWNSNIYIYIHYYLSIKNPKFLEKAKSSYMGPLENRVDKYICEGLQTFTPEPKRYGIINNIYWIHIAIKLWY